MSTIEDKSTGRCSHCVKTTPHQLWRWTSLFLLIAAEFLTLSIRFDPIAYSNVLGQFSLLVQLGISLGAALLIFGGPQIKESARRLALEIESRRFPWPCLVVHLVAWGVFYQLTRIVFEGNTQSQSIPSLWLMAWVFGGLMWIASWIATAVPVSLWTRLNFMSRRVLFFGTFLALLAVGVGRFAESFWRPLALWTLWIVERLLGLLYSTVSVEPDELLIGTGSFSARIAPVCSGYEGMGLIIVFLGSFLWWFRKELRFPRSFLLLIVGIAAIWLVNAVRIAALMTIGSSISQSVAVGGFHSQAGWLSFNLVALGLITVAWRSPFFAKQAAPSATASRRFEYPAAAYLVPFLVFIAMAMITGALSSGGIDRLYSLRVVAAAVALGFFFGAYRQRGILAWSLSWQAATVGVVVFCLWMALEPLAGIDDETRSAHAAAMSNMQHPLATLWIVFRAIGSVLIAPVVEELAFRGYLTRRLIADDFDSVPMGQFTWFSFFVSSTVFGLLHGRWLAGTLAGMLFAWALYRRGRLMDAVLAHATANGLITIYVLSTQNWAAWS